MSSSGDNADMNLEERVAALTATVLRQQAEIEDLRHQHPGPIPRPASGSSASSRRQLLRTGAVATIAGVAALGLGSKPAAAADGDALEIGANNVASTTTRLDMDNVGNVLEVGNEGLGTAIRGAAETGTGVSGSGGVGVSGISTVDDGWGVYGANWAETGDAVGVRGKTLSAQGSGVFGEAPSPTGVTTGVRGESSSTGGRGVHGVATGATGVATGVLGESQSPAGIGVAGFARGIGSLFKGPVAVMASGSISVVPFSDLPNNTPEAPIHVKQSGSPDSTELLLLLESDTSPQQIFKNNTSTAEWFFAMTSDDQFKISKQGTGVVEAKFFDNGDLTIAGTLNQTSDVNKKTNVRQVDPNAVLDAVARMPVSTWEYKAAPDVTHMGPTAQDFAQAFGLGAGDTTIAAVDADGVALAAIQALYSQNQDLRHEVDALQCVISDLDRRAG